MKLKTVRGKFRRELIRPLIHTSFVRFVLGLTVALAGDFFFRPLAGRDLREILFLALALTAALMAVIAWLRLDGLRLPKLMMLRIQPRKKPTRMYGDMADYLDERPETRFEDLEDSEKDLCLLGADAICCVLFLIAAVIAALV